MKKFISMLIVVVTLFSFPITTYASEADNVPTQEIQMITLDDYTEEWRPMTRWANISIITMSVKSSGGNVTASYDVQGYFPENTIRVTCNLQELYNAKWRTVTSQYKSGKFYCMGNVSAKMEPNKYTSYTRLILNITVLDKNGRVIENITAYSKTHSVL